MLRVTRGFFHSSQKKVNGGVGAASRTMSSAKLSTAAATPTAAKVAAVHPSYEAIEQTDIEEYGVSATLYKHKKSGAQVLSVIAPEDNNKVFGIVFRTPPDDSKGLPHILEHSVLCGSRKFPVKEPFVDLIKGSLNTFLNAFTYPDRTCYPVASMNTKDFYNLIDVYLDAVLHPRAINDPKVLEQEGWHFELEDAAKPLEYKGVVYNEMKGVYSSPDSILGRATQRALFPDNTYGVDSGGDPREIPNLGFDQFKDFHSKYYHPSNSRVYFYGDDDPLKRLELLDEYLQEFDAIPVDSAVAIQKKTDLMDKLDITFPVQAGMPAKHMLTVNWLLHDEDLTHREQLDLGVLDSLLLGRSSSPLRKRLTESQLGESVAGGGLSDELLQATFSVGLKGVSPENADAIEPLILEELTRLSNDGFDSEDVTAAINTLEFGLREFNTGGFPRGLSLMLAMLNKWIYDKDAFEAIRFEESLASLKSDLKEGKPVFQTILKKYFVANKHRVTVEMKPDEALEQQNLDWEVNKLAALKKGMSMQEIEEIIAQTAILKEQQAAEDSPEAKASIPRLTLEDIDKKVKEIPIAVEKHADGTTVLTHELQSNGILYADIGFDFSRIPASELVLLPLLTRMMTETGTTELDEVGLSRRIGSETGGVGVTKYTDAKYVAGGIADLNDPIMYLLVRGKATKDKVSNLFNIFGDVLMKANLGNEKRAVEMLKESKVRMQTSVITAGHSYGATRLAARHSLLGFIAETTGGLTYARDVADLLEQAKSDWPSVQHRLEVLRETIVKKGDVVVNLTGSKDVLDAASPVVESFLSSVPAGPESCGTKLADSFKQSDLLPMEDEGFSVASQVNYVVKGAQVLKPGDAVSGAYSVASRYLSTGFLWDHVRVMGGAYGGFSRFSGANGRATFLSYRDPNLADTLLLYDRAAAVLAEEADKIDDEDILQAVIGAVGELDAPMGPDSKGFTSMVRYLTDETEASRQQWRDEVLGTSSTDFKTFAGKLGAIQDQGSVVVFGSHSALETANEALPEARKLKITPAISGEK